LFTPLQGAPRGSVANRPLIHELDPDQKELAESRSDGPLTVAEVRRLVESLKDIPKVLADAEPAMKARVYAELGIRITYEPGSRVVIAEARPASTSVRVGGGT